MLAALTLDEITQETLAREIEAGLFEGQDLEFKRQAYGGSDADTKEMLRDVASLTNGGGGMLLLGVEEDGVIGKAQSILPVQNGDVAAERILASCLSNIAERISGLDARPIPVTGGHVIAVRCPRSFRAPHMITYRDINQFWIRHQRSKHRMTLQEIREMFKRTETYGQDLREVLKEQRRGLESWSGFYVLITIAPYGPLVDVVDINDDLIRELLSKPPMIDWYLDGVQEVRPTLDGLSAKGNWGNYNDWKLDLGRDAKLSLLARIPAHNSEYRRYPTIQSLCKYPVSLGMLGRELYRHLGVTGPFMLSMDLFANVDQAGLQGLHHSLQRALKGINPEIRFTKKRVNPPESIVQDLKHPDRAFRSLLDRIWNAFGRDACDYFDEKGNLTT